MVIAKHKVAGQEKAALQGWATAAAPQYQVSGAASQPRHCRPCRRRRRGAQRVPALRSESTTKSKPSSMACAASVAMRDSASTSPPLPSATGQVMSMTCSGWVGWGEWGWERGQTEAGEAAAGSTPSSPGSPGRSVLPTLPPENAAALCCRDAGVCSWWRAGADPAGHPPWSPSRGSSSSSAPPSGRA